MIQLNTDYSLKNIICCLMALDLITPLADFRKENPCILPCKNMLNKEFISRILFFSNRKTIRTLSKTIFLTSKIIYSYSFNDNHNLTADQIRLTKNYFKRFRYLYYLYFDSTSNEKSLKELNTIALRMLILFH